MLKTKILFILTSFFSIYFPLFAFDGSGTAEEPYLISSTDDWNQLASNTQGGETYAGKYFELTSNIGSESNPVTTYIGDVTYRNTNYGVFSSPKPFSGILNGKGHTITINLNLNEDRIAPFRALKDAVIINLNLAGTVTGRRRSAAFATISYGNTFIANCHNSISITFTDTGDGGCQGSGFVGNSMSGNLVIKNCLFDGKLLGNQGGISGFVGYNRPYTSATTTIQNCYYSPSERQVMGESFTFCRYESFKPNDVKIQNCWYSKSMKTLQGTSSDGYSAESLCQKLGSTWHVVDGKPIPVTESKNLKNAVIYGLDYVYDSTETIPTPIVIADKILTEGTDFLFSTSSKEGLTECPTYCITATGIGDYSGEITFEYYIADEVFVTTDDELSEEFRVCGFMKENDEYLIKTAGDLNNLSRFVNASVNNGCSSKNFRLTNDIDFKAQDDSFSSVNYTPIGMLGGLCKDTWAGSSPMSFSGNFDGDGHTISGVNTASMEDHSAIFGELISGSIKNLTIKNSRFYCTGSSTSCGKGSIAGINSSGHITNCHILNDVYIYTTSDSTTNVGGISGQNSGTISGCSSAANIINSDKSGTEYTNCSYYGGIAGQNKGTIEHCFYYGDNIKASSNYGSICGANSGILTGNFHTNDKCAAVNNQDTENAIHGYCITSGQNELEIVSKIDDGIEYGRITGSDSTIIFDGLKYLPYDTSAEIYLNYTGTIPESTLVFGYFYTENNITHFQENVSKNGNYYTITLPKSNVLLYACYEFGGNGTDTAPYTIYDPRQLDLLSKRVNYGGNTYEGKYFLLTNHLIFDGSENNFEPIGGYYNGSTQDFCGIFQDESSETNGSEHGTHIIMGINVTKTRTSNEDKYIGLFGRIGSTGDVRYINLQDCYFEGHASVGGIAGYNAGTLTTCTTAASVKISGQNPSSSNHGGIAGYNTGKIIQCASSAEVSNYSCAGGIAGNNSGGVLMGCMYYGETSEPVLTAVSYAGSLVGHFESGTLSQNYYSGTSTNAVGKVSYSEDVSGATRAYTISSELGTLSLRNDLGSRGLAYNSILFSPESLSIKISFDSYTPDDSITLGLAAKNNDGENFPFETIEDGVYSFTMPAYDVTVVQIAKVSFETKGGSEISDKYVTLGESLGTIENPTKGDGEAFEGWYLDEDFTEEFDLSSKITKNITLYANFSEGLEITANKNPYAEGEFYTTFYYPKKNCRADTNTRVFYVTKFKNGKVSLEEEESKLIPKGQAVILKSSSPNLSLIFTENTGNFEYENILSGTDKEIETAEEGTYILSLSKKGGVGFYKWSGKISGHKGFLIMSNEE